MEPEPPGDTTFMADPEPEQVFFWVGSGLFKAAPAAYFRQAKEKSLLLVTNVTFRQFRRVNMVQNRIILIIHFLRAQKENFLYMQPEPPGATFFCLEPEPTKVGLSRSRSLLWDLGHIEPKKVAAPQHCMWYTLENALFCLTLIN